MSNYWICKQGEQFFVDCYELRNWLRDKLPNMVVFMPETVDAWDDDTFVSFQEARDLGVNIPGGRYPLYIPTTVDEFHKIVAFHGSKK
jgi:hypothetical protein